MFISYTSLPDESILQAIQSENLDNGDYAVMLYAPLSGYDFAFADANTTNQYLDALKTVILFSDDTPQQIDVERYNSFLQRVADTSAQPPINIVGTTVSCKLNGIQNIASSHAHTFNFSYVDRHILLCNNNMKNYYYNHCIWCLKKLDASHYTFLL